MVVVDKGCWFVKVGVMRRDVEGERCPVVVIIIIVVVVVVVHINTTTTSSCKGISLTLMRLLLL